MRHKCKRKSKRTKRYNESSNTSSLTRTKSRSEAKLSRQGIWTCRSKRIANANNENVHNDSEANEIDDDNSQ